MIKCWCGLENRFQYYIPPFGALPVTTGFSHVLTIHMHAQ